jgi:hypothetical protein
MLVDTHAVTNKTYQSGKCAGENAQMCTNEQMIALLHKTLLTISAYSRCMRRRRINAGTRASALEKRRMLTHFVARFCKLYREKANGRLH